MEKDTIFMGVDIPVELKERLDRYIEARNEKEDFRVTRRAILRIALTEWLLNHEAEVLETEEV